MCFYFICSDHGGRRWWRGCRWPNCSVIHRGCLSLRVQRWEVQWLATLFPSVNTFTTSFILVFFSSSSVYVCSPQNNNNIHSGCLCFPSHGCGSASPENLDVDEEGLFKHSTTLTNKQRGNEVTVRPATLDCEYGGRELRKLGVQIIFNIWSIVRLLRLYPHQLCPYTSWQPRARSHKWLHTWAKVRDLDTKQTQHFFLSFFFFCELKCKKIPAPSSVLQTAHCSANRMNGASLLSCGRQRSERRQWWIFSWRRLEMISGRLGRTSSVIETKCIISLMFICFFFFF